MKDFKKRGKEILRKALSYYEENEFSTPKELIIAKGYLEDWNEERILRELKWITL